VTQHRLQGLADPGHADLLAGQLLWLAMEGMDSVTKTLLGQCGCGQAQAAAGQREGGTAWALRDKTRSSVVSFLFFIMRSQLSDSARVGSDQSRTVWCDEA